MNEYNPSGRYVITYTEVIFIHIYYIPKCTRLERSTIACGSLTFCLCIVCYGLLLSSL
ncbi:hypothetical protein HanIR_Chr04g0151531 [Helianthus annuus]|nr:hypothetical protein HanIR_Chr04g0151531 [Helianthus annuus]